jgi:hypothetical protein
MTDCSEDAVCLPVEEAAHAADEVGEVRGCHGAVRGDAVRGDAVRCSAGRCRAMQCWAVAETPLLKQ